MSFFCSSEQRNFLSPRAQSPLPVAAARRLKKNIGPTKLQRSEVHKQEHDLDYNNFHFPPASRLHDKYRQVPSVFESSQTMSQWKMHRSFSDYIYMDWFRIQCLAPVICYHVVWGCNQLMYGMQSICLHCSLLYTISFTASIVYDWRKMSPLLYCICVGESEGSITL